MKIEGSRTYDNKIFSKVFTLHKSMMSRCYNKNSSSYIRYGGEGVRVGEEWHDLNNFIETIDKVDGFDLDLWLEGKLELDKDIKQKNLPQNKKIYSVDTCCFVSRSENSGNRRNNRNMVIIDIEGNKYYSSNREKFCREHKLSARHAFKCLKGNIKHHKGWQFFYEEDFDETMILKPRLIEALSPDGKIYTFNNISCFAKEHNLSSPNITMVISGKNKHHKGWKFKEIQSGFLIL